MEGRFTMQRKLTFLASLLVAVVLAACAGPLQTGPTPPAREFLPAQVVEPVVYPFTGDTGVQQLELPSVWFVEVDGTPTVDGGSIQALSQSVTGVFGAAADAGVALEPRFVFSTFITGFSVAAGPADVLTLANLPGVKRVLPVGIVEAPRVVRHDPAEVSPQLTTALGLTGADFVQDTLGFDGDGIRVGIIDTGILLDHPEFGGRVQFGFDFVGDLYNAGDPNNDVPVPEPGPFTRPGGGDCNGHGTHVAGIVGAGAGGEVTGVAPGVILGAYRVFGCAGSSHSDVVLAGVERAFADGMDVVNLSLGSNNGWPQDFSSVALSRMLEFGMIPVASAGNNGASGIYTLGSPGVGDNVITVASFDNVAFLADKMIVDGTEMGYATLTGTPDTPTSGTTPEIVYVGQGCDADDYLDDPTDKVALVTRGGCTFAEKYFRAFDEGAVGVIIENNADPLFFGTIGETSDLGFGISISGVSGEIIQAAIDAGAEPFITWTDETISEVNPTGELISDFSSYGLAPDLTLKPDIGAPGGFINSTIIDGAEPGVAGTAGYAVLSGTSMSAPHVAGAVALMLEARPDVSRDSVRDHLMNAADPMLWNLNPPLGFLDSVHRQGAGMLRIDDAILNRNYAVPAKLSLGESAAGAFVDVMTIHNDTAEPVTYFLGQIEDFGTAPVATTGNSNAPGFALAPPLVEYFELRQSSFFDPIDSITVPAGGVASFRVRVTANPDAGQGTLYGTYLVFLPLNGVPGAMPILVPAAGFAGDYQQLPVISFLPELVVSFLGDLFLVDPGWVYTMAGEDIPYFAIGMAHPAQQMTVEIVPLGERAWIGPQPAFEAELIRRNNPGFLSVYGFPGDFDASGLPTGEYMFRIQLLKAEGDPTNPTHTEVVESPSFFIDRGFEF